MEAPSTPERGTHRLVRALEALDGDLLGERGVVFAGGLRIHEGPVPERAWSKSERAYGRVVPGDLRKAIDHFLSRDAHRARCFDHMGIRSGDELTASVTQLLSDVAEREALDG